MEPSELLARLNKARECDIKARGDRWTFKLRLPSDFQERRFALDARGVSGASQSQLWMRDMLIAGLIGWEGITLDDLLHEGDATPLPFSPALVAPLLEGNLDVFDELCAAFHAERKARQERLEASAKNSASASAGN